MPRVCKLHIGSGKSGSTSIQKYLFDRCKKMKENGILYPTSCLWQGDYSHNTLGIYMWENFYETFKTRSYNQVLRELVNELKGWDHVIISSELFEKVAKNGKNTNFEKFLSTMSKEGFVLDIIYVIRRQDYYIESLFKQVVSSPYGRYSGSHSDFVERNAPYLSYGIHAEAWMALPAVRSISVFPFIEKDAEASIFKVLKRFEALDSSVNDAAPPNLNRSLEGIYLRLKHWLNRRSNNMSLHRRYVDSVSTGTKEYQSAKTILFLPRDRKEFVDRYRSDLERLVEKFSFDPQAFRVEIGGDGDLFEELGEHQVGGAIEHLELIDPGVAARLRALKGDKF